MCRVPHYGSRRLLLLSVILNLRIAVPIVSAIYAVIATSSETLLLTRLIVGIWMALNKLGSVIGNAIQLALNMDTSSKGSISPKTYLVLIGLSCAGLPLALTVAPAHKLIRKDGTKPTFSSDENRITLKEGLKGFWKATKQKYMLLLIPIFITVRWSQTYQGNYLTEYFSVRGRTLAGFVQTVVGIVATVLWGWLLDSQKIFKTRRGTAIAGWLTMVAVFIPQWVLNFVMQTDLQKQSPTPSLDIYDPGYGKAIAAYCLFGYVHLPMKTERLVTNVLDDLALEAKHQWCGRTGFWEHMISTSMSWHIPPEFSVHLRV